MSEPTDLIPMHSPADDDATPGFTVVRRGGYDTSQVDGHVAWLEDQLREAEEARGHADRQAEQHRREAAEAQDELAAGRPDWDAFGERITTILRLAEEEGETIRAQRLSEADALLADARRTQGDADRNHSNRMREAEQEAQEMLRSAQVDSERIVSEAHEQAEQEHRVSSRRLAELERQRDAVHAQLARLHEGLAAALQIQLPPDEVDAGESSLRAESR